MKELSKVTGLESTTNEIVVQESFRWAKSFKYDVEAESVDCTPSEYRDAIFAIKQNAFMMGAAYGFLLKDTHKEKKEETGRSVDYMDF